MTFFLIMLAGITGGYLKWRQLSDDSLAPIATAVVGGMIGYWGALAVVPPVPDDVVWSESIRQVASHDELNAVLAEDVPGATLVDFYADWCPPCRAEVPALNEIANEGGRVVVVNVDRSPQIAEWYSVSALPTAIVFKNGAEVKRTTGGKSKRALQKLLVQGAQS
jgi:thioredoxin 1